MIYLSFLVKIFKNYKYTTIISSSFHDKMRIHKSQLFYELTLDIKSSQICVSSRFSFSLFPASLSREITRISSFFSKVLNFNILASPAFFTSSNLELASTSLSLASVFSTSYLSCSFFRVPCSLAAWSLPCSSLAWRSAMESLVLL